MSSREIVDYYATTGVETTRLSRAVGWIERLRTLEIMHRYLPPAPATILDVGGATGGYALPLAREGYRVHLIDPVELHVAAARVASARQSGTPLASATLGDARRLEFADGSADAVLLMGPLYHLTDRADRLKALAEARRCLRPGGVVFAAAISKYASIFDAFRQGLLEDPQFETIVERDLREGQHRNPTGEPKYFTTAFFHHPDELLGELRESGFADAEVLAVEGPAWLSPKLEQYGADDVLRERVLDYVRRVEREPAIMGASAHLLGVGRRK